MRPEALAALGGSDLIIHAGDVGKPEIIEQLRGIAPTFAVRRNIDTQSWAARLPEAEIVKVGQLSFFVLHDISQLEVDPIVADFAAVVFGHSHKPVVESRDGILFVNPGSAGPRRFKLPIAIGELLISGDQVDARIIELSV